MVIKDFVKKELQGWSLLETVGLILVFVTIFVNAIINHDSIIAVISALCGISYTFLAGKGKISCYLFGVTGSGFYAYLSFINALWGNLILYLCYYIPMQILGIFRWRKHLNKNSQEIEKTKLSTRSRVVLVTLLFFASVITILVLKYFNGSNPIIDGVTSILSVAGMYLTVRRAIEQWIIWLVVNFLTAIMWIEVLIQGEKVYATVIMWVVYFLFAIYFYIKWRKELLKNNH